MGNLKSEKELKNESIIIRVTESKKKDMLAKAKQSGLSLTKYIEQLADKTVIISLIQAQSLVKEIHLLNQQLNEYRQKGLNVDQLQDIISDKVLHLQQNMKNEEF